ncbi:hypothetical protein FM106_02390 [Brachybacterium faecium]|nr:hypothetical protein FM106_02390 [Brachybacterium faecium]
MLSHGSGFLLVRADGWCCIASLLSRPSSNDLGASSTAPSQVEVRDR